MNLEAHNDMTPPVAGSSALSVYQVTQLIDRGITENPALQGLAIVGEITDFKRHSSGHIYFTLADKEKKAGKGGPARKASAVINCTFFRHHNQELRFKPEKGMEVLVFGQVSVYYPRGTYNLNVRRMAEVGTGALLLRMQQLKKKLIDEGVIDPQLRKPLPRLPRRIGIVTGITSAALRDILKQVHDRYPHVELVIAPALVQGEGAPKSIAAALAEVANRRWQCDAILLSRGGGSAEDLMAFNDELVARAIHACELPVVSAVGHQVDHPISDDVADVAAATPTDGAKLLLPEIAGELEGLDIVKARLTQSIELRLSYLRERLGPLADRPIYADPYVLVEGHYQRLDDFEARMLEMVQGRVAAASKRLAQVADHNLLLGLVFEQKSARFQLFAGRLDAFSPLATLKRGYSVTYQRGKIVKSVKDIDRASDIEIQLADGKFKARPSSE